MSAGVRLSAFGDEISDDLQVQIDTLADLDVRFLELRGAWGKNVLELDDSELQAVREQCERSGLAVSAIGSPIGKSPLIAPLEHELGNLARSFKIAAALNVEFIRVFSFYPPENAGPDSATGLIDESAQRLGALAARAADAGMTLLLENEKGIVGDTIPRCHALLQAVESAAMRFAWDPANFVQVGELAATVDGWPLLEPYVAHVHVKDADANGDVRPAGQGAGQVGLLLDRLRDSGYAGFLALEPHLAIAGHSTGFSGVDGMTHAVEVLRSLMAERHLPEV